MADRDELRAKLAAKVASLKIMREPKERPHLDAIADVKPRATPVEVTKKDKKRKSEMTVEKKAAKKQKVEVKPSPPAPQPVAQPKPKGSISFGNFSFGKEVDTRLRIKHGSKKVRINKEIKSIKAHEAALKRAQETGGIEAKMNLAKQTAMDRAMKRAAGLKVHDSLSKLKKTQRSREAKKSKSAKAWSQRTSELQDTKQQRIEKRNENISKFKLKKKPSLAPTPADQNQ